MNSILAFLYFILLYGGGEKGGLLDVNPGLIFWTVITFIILLLILKKIAWMPILKAISEREEKIKRDIEEAEKKFKEAEELHRRHQQALEEAEYRVRQLLSEGREYANRVRDDIIAKANVEAQKIFESARLEIENQKIEAMNELKQIVADLSIQVAEKILEETVDKDKNQKLIDQLIQKLPKG